MALVQKADVKQRVRRKLSKNADQLRRVTIDPVRQRPLPFAAMAAFCRGLLVGRRSGRKADPRS
jgi:hypothetical protein